MPKTILYKNNGKHDVNIPTLGVIPAGETLSITSNYLPPVILENYPGLEDITDEPSPTKKGKNE